MSEKKFLSWVGFTNSEKSPKQEVAASESASSANSTHSSPLERIRQLEAQIADLRARRDITSLTKEEFEILATETAMNLIKTAQSREAKAAAIASKAMNDATRSATAAINDAQSKVKEMLSGAQTHAEKVLSTAQAQAQEAISRAQTQAEALAESKRREATATTTAAKREAERLVQEATSEIANFRGWLSTAISESERLHRIQTQSLNAAEEAIKQTRSRLHEAFEKLEKLGEQISANLTEDHRPLAPTFTRSSTAKTKSEKGSAELAKKPAATSRKKSATSTRKATDRKSSASRSAKAKRK